MADGCRTRHLYTLSSRTLLNVRHGVVTEAWRIFQRSHFNLLLQRLLSQFSLIFVVVIYLFFSLIGCGCFSAGFDTHITTLTQIQTASFWDLIHESFRRDCFDLEKFHYIWVWSWIFYDLYNHIKPEDLIVFFIDENSNIFSRNITLYKHCFSS